MDKGYFKEQALRCLDCGTPFCHWGCPIGNYIPEWNGAVLRGQWEKAFLLLDATNNLPEITGRVCPAPCEFACVLDINDKPVTIKENELAIIEYGFKKGLVKPAPPKKRSSIKIAIVGSGPAGLACAAQLNKAGHNVVVFEKDNKIGGILRYGIPDFKLEKWVLDRRIKLLEKEGVKFETGINIGKDLAVSKLKKEFNAICLSGGCRLPRDLKIEGRNLNGIHFAMDYLTEANRKSIAINARGKKVVVIGGGDTGADCAGVAHRQGASCVIQVELLPKPPECRPIEQPWPKYPLILKTSTNFKEGGERRWSLSTKRFIGENGNVKKLFCARVEFEKNVKNCQRMKEVPGSEFEIEASLVILALGFVHPEKSGLLEELSVELDSRGNVKTDENYMTSVKNIFSAGDMRRGQSLIVGALSEGRRAAHHIDKYLMGRSCLPII